MPDDTLEGLLWRRRKAVGCSYQVAIALMMIEREARHGEAAIAMV